jgi:hypothetical protein
LQIILNGSEALEKGSVLVKVGKPWLGNGIFIAPGE